jgi:hypothetical protein
MIGGSAYEGNPLSNPVNDATYMVRLRILELLDHGLARAIGGSRFGGTAISS